MSKPVCVVVGYGPGVGQGVAKAFGRAGYSLGLLARNPEKHATSLAELRAEGLVAEVFAADAGDEKLLAEGLNAAQQSLGAAEVVVYNAVAFRMSPPTAIAADDLLVDFRTNVAGALIAARCVVPAMKARGRGAILFTGGGWAIYPSAAVASTAIGKAGLRHLALMLAEELQGSGIRAGTITIMGEVAPGTAFDPERIGVAFLDAVKRPADQFEPEIQFTGT
jgi:NAD(P)-dependent dehydrogenase (short-subunit alcohol dehydrogenase family)